MTTDADAEDATPTDVSDKETDEFDDEVVSSRNWVFPAIAALVVVGFAVATFFVLNGSDSAQAEGPEGVPIQKVPDLAPHDSTVDGSPVNGITCRPTMGQDVKFHIHQRISIFVNGEQFRIPAGIGITGPLWEQEIDGFPFVNNGTQGCVYWIHTHAEDGIIHIESPEERTFTLGDLFDVWGQPLSRTQVGPAKGPVVAYLDGKRYADPRAVPLTESGVIQLNVGEPDVPFEPMEFEVKNVCGDGTLSCSMTPAS